MGGTGERSPLTFPEKFEKGENQGKFKEKGKKDRENEKKEAKLDINGRIIM